MKTVVLMGLSCLLLAGVFCILSNKSQANNISPFSQSINGTEAKVSTDISSSATSENKTDTSNLIDSHWLDDAEFQKAVEADLLNEKDMQADAPAQKADSEPTHSVSPKQQKEAPVTEPVPTIRQLILELDPDTTTNKKVPVEVV